MAKAQQAVFDISRLLDIRERYNLDPSDIVAHFNMLQKEEEAGIPLTVPASEFEGEMFVPGPKLLGLMDEIGRSGELEGLDTNQMVEAFAARMAAELVGEQRPASELSPFKPGPEFAEVMRGIDATRDAEGVPNDTHGDVMEFVNSCFRHLNRELLHPPLEVVIEWIANALVTDGMTAAARKRLSELIWSVYWHMKTIMAREDRNRGTARLRTQGSGH